MDPLSVAASIVGLATAAKQISSICGKLLASRQTGSKEIENVKTTVDTLRSVLLQVQILVLGQSVIDTSRGDMILVDEVITTLSACVLTLSDLDRLVKGIESERQLGLLDTIRWTTRASELSGFFQKLEAHKSSLSLILSILTCRSVREAQNAVLDLKALVLRVLESNALLAGRMSAIQTPRAPSMMTTFPDSGESIIRQESLQEMGELYPTSNLMQDASPRRLSMVTFKKDLHNSWVYQRCLAKGPRTFSLNSASQLSQSWSVFSGLSLSKVSNIAVIALPIERSDLNNDNLYVFGNDDGNVHGALNAWPLGHKGSMNLVRPGSSESERTVSLTGTLLQQWLLIRGTKQNIGSETSGSSPIAGFLPEGLVIAKRASSGTHRVPFGYRLLSYVQDEIFEVVKSNYFTGHTGFCLAKRCWYTRQEFGWIRSADFQVYEIISEIGLSSSSSSVSRIYTISTNF